MTMFFKYLYGRVYSDFQCKGVVSVDGFVDNADIYVGGHIYAYFPI